MKIFKLGIIAGLLAMLGISMSPALVFADRITVSQPINTGVLPPNLPGGQEGSKIVTTPTSIIGVTIDLSDTSATINWSTSDLVLPRISWGTTTDYSMGSIYGEQYSKKHSQLITALQPHTKYYFKLTAVNLGYYESVFTGEFTILAVQTTGPQNVNQFFAKSQNDRIVLTWDNPVGTNFEEVRIVRSDKFFPLDPFNGQTIYTGRDTRFEDINITPGVIYYYSAFVKDRNGKYSSGALSSAMVLWFSEGDGTDLGSPIVDLQIPFIGSAVSVSKFSDLIISYEDGTIVNSENATVPLGKNLKVTFPEERVSEDSAFMTLSIKDSKHLTTDSTFLFNHDTKNKEYNVVTPIFKREQAYELVVTVFNSSKLIIQKINGTVKIVSASDGSGEDVNVDGVSWPAAHPTTTAIVVVGAGGALFLSLRYLRAMRFSNSTPPPKK